jgi:polar amino acid transport system substrate-binding protein
MSLKILKTLAAAVAVGVMALTAPMEARADLKELIASGVVRIGVPIDVPPFGYVDEKQQAVGLDVEMAKLVAKELGVKLELQQITGANRLPFLLTNKIDLIIASLGSNPERAKSIAFSSPYVSAFIGVFGAKEHNVTSADQLGKLRIGLTRGTTQDLELQRIAPNATIIRFDDDATSAAAYLSGQVDLFATLNLVIVDLNKKNPGKNIETKFVLRQSPGHIGLRQGNPDLLRWLDTFIFYHRMTGTLDRLSREWINSPFPNDLPSF